MEYSAVFLKARAITFSLISLISFLWVVVLCVDIFIQWNALGASEKSFLSVMLLSNTLTLVLLLVLLILPFRPWLDGARLMLLLITHIGIASGFVLWNSKFTCPTKTADQEGVCRLLNMYILIANWVIPALLVGYALGLGLMIYRRRKIMAASPDLESNKFRKSQQSILPMMKAGDIRHASLSTSTPHLSIVSQQRRESSNSLSNLHPPPMVKVKHSSIAPHISIIGQPHRGSTSATYPSSISPPQLSVGNLGVPNTPMPHTSFPGRRSGSASVNPSVSGQRRGSVYPSISDQRRGSGSPQQSLVESKRSSSAKGRLSKPLPNWMYY
ncbi:hypothetical protein BDP27DRAFT_1324733 [Rhodocollybia butyracea]|uniref:Uncharacterized protein n=1 Tax=Rhodocollybia butyracea TaxID=206335 RepID=A0A9P5PUY1_9AGAR|nr:hypothetical protein BDP27DRAFT_1324733 [Rhodocollybia butyracea]